MKVKKITMIPSDLPEKTQLTIEYEDDAGLIQSTEALGSMLMTAINNNEFFLSVQGDVMVTLNLMADQLLNQESFLFRAIMAAYGASIKMSDEDQVASLYNVFSTYLDMCADRNDELTKR